MVTATLVFVVVFMTVESPSKFVIMFTVNVFVSEFGGVVVSTDFAVLVFMTVSFVFELLLVLVVFSVAFD